MKFIEGWLTSQAGSVTYCNAFIVTENHLRFAIGLDILVNEQ